MAFTLKQIALEDDLSAICAQMTPENWAADNEMTNYREDALRHFLKGENNLLMLAYNEGKIVGAALCYVLPHPAGDDSLYVHELDTHPDYRRQGVSRAMMYELCKIARERNLDEVWVGTETTNTIADTFYRSLKPYEVEPSYIYAYKVGKLSNG